MIRDIVLNAAAVLSGAASSTVIAVVLTRVLTPSQVGQYSLLAWVITLGTGVATLGLPTAVIRYAAELSADESAAARFIGWILRRHIGVTALAAVASGVLSAGLLHGWWWALPVGFAVGPGASGIVRVAAFRGLRRFAALAVRQVIAGAVLVAAVLLAVRISPAVPVLAAALAVQAWVALGIYQRGLPHDAGAPPAAVMARFNRAVVRLGVLAIVDLIVWQRSEVFFLGLLRPSADVAMYALPYTLAGMLMLVPGSIGGVLLPYVSQAPADRDRTASVYSEGMRHLAVAALPIALGAVLFAEPLIRIAFGAAYAASARTFQILVLTGAVTAVASAGSAVLVGEEAVGFMVRWGFAAAAADVALAILLIPRWGALGAACANAAAQLFAIGVTLAYLIRVRGLRVPWIPLTRIAVAAAAGGMAARAAWGLMGAADLMPLLVSAGVGLGVFVAAGRAIGALRTSPRSHLM